MVAVGLQPLGQWLLSSWWLLTTGSGCPHGSWRPGQSTNVPTPAEEDHVEASMVTADKTPIAKLVMVMSCAAAVAQATAAQEIVSKRSGWQASTGKTATAMRPPRYWS